MVHPSPEQIAGLEVHSRIVQAREWLAEGSDLEADSVLRDLEHDLKQIERAVEHDAL